MFLGHFDKSGRTLNYFVNITVFVIVRSNASQTNTYSVLYILFNNSPTVHKTWRLNSLPGRAAAVASLSQTRFRLPTSYNARRIGPTLTVEAFWKVALSRPFDNFL